MSRKFPRATAFPSRSRPRPVISAPFEGVAAPAAMIGQYAETFAAPAESSPAREAAIPSPVAVTI
jgi:hypothetical protein